VTSRVRKGYEGKGVREGRVSATNGIVGMVSMWVRGIGRNGRESGKGA